MILIVGSSALGSSIDAPIWQKIRFPKKNNIADKIMCQVMCLSHPHAAKHARFKEA